MPAINIQLLKDNISILVFFLCIILLKSSLGWSGHLLLFGLILIIYQRSEIHIDKELKEVLFLFLFYILLFSIISDYHSKSIKGLYDILRGMILFPMTYLFLNTVNRYEKTKSVLLLLSLIYLLGNFNFQHKREMFFGYNDNMNNVAVDVFFVYCFSAFLVGKFWWDKVVFALLSVAAATLLYYANSRGLLLGIGIGLIALVTVNVKNIWRIFILIAISSSFVWYFLSVNWKGFRLGRRDEIWSKLIEYIFNGDWFLGYGLNSVKVLVPTVTGIKTTTTHNLFLEILLSSGVVGLLLFLFILFKLISYLLHQNYSKNLTFYASSLGLISFFIAHQFDLKFAGFAFTGITMVLLAGLYSNQISKKPDENRDNR